MIPQFNDIIDEVSISIFGDTVAARSHEVSILSQIRPTQIIQEIAAQMEVMDKSCHASYVAVIAERASSFLLVAASLAEYVARTADHFGVPVPDITQMSLKIHSPALIEEAHLPALIEETHESS